MITASKTHAFGASGKRYDFHVHEIGTAYKTIAGVYMFIRERQDRSLAVAYVGECGDFDDRLNINLKSHHRWACIRKECATHIATLHVPGERQARLDIETDLREALDPPCNRQ